MRHALVAAAITGLGVGVVWSVVYGLSPAPWIVIGANLIASLLILAGLRLVSRRLAQPASAVLAAVFALAVAPAVLAPLYHRRVLWGVGGALADLGVVAAAALFGAALGLAARASRRMRVAAAGAAALAVIGGVVIVGSSSAGRSRPVALGRALPGPLPPRAVLVFGIDGGDWAVAEPLMDRGQLPNLAGLVARGQHGVLRSLQPMYSPVVWTSIFTGRRPAAHGIDDWSTADTRNLRAAPLWDVFDAARRRSLVVNVPGTWPPQPLAHGAIVAGIPIPAFDPTATPMPLGSVFSSEEERGVVPTRSITRLAPGRFAFEIRRGSLTAPGKIAVHNVLIDLAWRHVRLLRTAVRFTARVEGSGVILSGNRLRQPVTLTPGAPMWITVAGGRVDMVMLAAVLDAGPDRLRLFLSQPTVAPWSAPDHIASGLPAALFADRTTPFVVEGPAWTAWRDRRIGNLLPAALRAVEERHATLVLGGIRALHPQLVCYTVTLTDRMQHAFLALGRSGPGAPAGIAHAEWIAGDPVGDAYRLADRLLGEVLAAMPPDSLVVVVSDHGAAIRPRRGDAGHRPEGLWIAAGPPVAPHPDPVEMSVLDVVPSLMRCLGAPLAEDLDGAPLPGLCPAIPAVAAVATYSLPGGRDAIAQRIDESRRQQLRGLGYLQ